MGSEHHPETARQRLLEELESVRRRFADQLQGKVADLIRTWRRLQADSWAEPAVAELRRAVHGLAGTSGSLGFEDLAAAAQRLEVLIEAVRELGVEPTSEQVDQVEALLGALEKEAARPVVVHVDDLPLPAAADEKTASESRRVALHICDPGLRESLSSQLVHFGYEVAVIPSTDQMTETVERTSPLAVISDLASDDHPLGAARAVATMRERRGADVPVVFLSCRGDVEARLEAVRSGCAAYFTSPVETSAVIEVLEGLSEREASTWRVLIVDDDPAVAAFYGHALRHAGLETEEVSRPLEVPHRMVEFQPDVILMDVYMPGCSGVELAAVIRQEPAYAGIPIVFLSGEQNPMRQIFAIDQGGDDFFTKPVDPDQLVAAVQARAKRGRTLRSLLERDGLTGLLGHSHVREHLDLAVGAARRRGGVLSVAMIDVDRFKEINDEHGHLAGDHVLKSLAYLLRSRLRSTDMVGRYGGDECLVILPDTPAEAAKELVDEIRRKFASLEHRAAGRSPFSATVSCGVAEYRGGGVDDLVHAADQALYEAKRAGRNRVVATSLSDERTREAP